MLRSNIEVAIKTLFSNAGFVYSFHTGELNPTKGFSIAVSKTFEKVIHKIDRHIKSQIREKIKAYCLDHMDTLNAKNRFLGCWANDNKLYLDILEVVPESREEVEKMCTERNQSAYWDNEARRVVFVNHLKEV